MTPAGRGERVGEDDVSGSNVTNSLKVCARCYGFYGFGGFGGKACHCTTPLEQPQRGEHDQLRTERDALRLRVWALEHAIAELEENPVAIIPATPFTIQVVLITCRNLRNRVRELLAAKPESEV